MVTHRSLKEEGEKLGFSLRATMHVSKWEGHPRNSGVLFFPPDGEGESLACDGLNLTRVSLSLELRSLEVQLQTWDPQHINMKTWE